MSGLSYVGATATNPKDIVNRGKLTALLAAITPNQATVSTQINALVAGANPTYATKAYVDSQDATFALPSYYHAQDLLNIPTAVVGTTVEDAITGDYHGVASLDASTKIPAAMLPTVGAGFLLGPWGTTSTATGSTAGTPMRIADWNLGLHNVQFQPWMFLLAFVTGTNAHPIIEIRMADATTPPIYDDMTLVAQGMGRSYYNDYHPVAVIPAPDATSETPSLHDGTTYNIWLTAWLYDLNASSVSISTGGIASAAAFLWRGQE